MAKTVRVHDDTHRALKKLKARGRKGSIDEVVRDMIRATTGVAVDEVTEEAPARRLTSYFQD